MTSCSVRLVPFQSSPVHQDGRNSSNTSGANGCFVEFQSSPVHQDGRAQRFAMIAQETCYQQYQFIH